MKEKRGKYKDIERKGRVKRQEYNIIITIIVMKNNSNNGNK